MTTTTRPADSARAANPAARHLHPLTVAASPPAAGGLVGRLDGSPASGVTS